MKTVSSLFALIALAAALPLAAHTNLGSSVPADGASVPAPSEIRLEFSAAVRLISVNLRSADGDDIALANIPSEMASSFAIAITDPLFPGGYQVTWRSISGDSHVVSGEIRFIVTD